MGRDRARRSPKKRGKFHNSPKWPPAVPLWGQQWTSRCRFPHKLEMERQHNKGILWEFHSSRTSPTHNRQIPTEDRSSICANEFSLRWHYTIVMGDFNAKVGGQTNKSERATGCFGLGQRNERGDTLAEWATSNNFKIMNTPFQKKAGRRWTWRSPDGNTKNEIDYIITDKPSMVTDVTVINRVNIGSDHSMVLGSITLNTERKGGSF